MHRSPLSSMFKVSLCCVFPLTFFSSYAQEELSAAELKQLSVEELMNIKVTLVSRAPQQLTEAASAIQVITGDDIRRSGATNLPEALRLAPNVQVAQYNSNAWIVGVRGFSTIFANKLLVMIDGRTIYTPLFGGVIWDLQHVLLEDVDRIEVVSGPGATLWGANAVNGVINIVTKKSGSTQGAYVSAAAGNFLKDNFEARYGGKMGGNGHFRVYGLHSDRNSTYFPDDGTKNTDAWGVTQLGFRMDFGEGERDAFTVQGDFYRGTRKTTPAHSSLNGQNVSGTWTRTFSDESEMILKVYYDRYFREDIPFAATDELNTVDIDYQQRLSVRKKHHLVWGAGYRYVRDNYTAHTQNVAILPAKKNLDLFNAFIQDEVALGSRWRLTAGTKILHNVYTGIEIQPSVRTSFALRQNHTLWGAVSRAVRTPSRFDADYYLPAYPVPPESPSVAGGPYFESEDLLAYELGYRVQPTILSSFSLSTFYHVYSDLYSVEARPGTLTYQIMNGSEGKGWGVELSGAFRLTPSWKLRGGYTFTETNLRAKPGHEFDPQYLSNDAKHRFLVQSVANLPGNLQLDMVARYMDDIKQSLATAAVPDYLTFDARLAWVNKKFELSVVGQNLAKKRHAEFGMFDIPRSVYAKIAARF